MTQSSPIRKPVEGGSRDKVQETAAYSSLQIALIFNAFVSWTFAILMVYQPFAEYFWNGVGIPFDRSVSLLSSYWGIAVQFFVGILQFRLGYLRNEDELLSIARIHMFWWIGACASLVYLTQDGPLVLPNVVFMGAVAVYFGYAIAVTEGKQAKAIAQQEGK